MNNLQYSSGERNHYFSGKLMTVRDFESEQTYLNDKRRLGNRMLHGAGIVSGLGVLLADSQSFSLEAGMALDYLGREIVVREPSVKRLSVIKGFENIQGSQDVYLGIAYREELQEGTFAVSGQEGGVREEFNRVREGYELFLTTRRPNPASGAWSGCCTTCARCTTGTASPSPCACRALPMWTISSRCGCSLRSGTYPPR